MKPRNAKKTAAALPAWGRGASTAEVAHKHAGKALIGVDFHVVTRQPRKKSCDSWMRLRGAVSTAEGVTAAQVLR